MPQPRKLAKSYPLSSLTRQAVFQPQSLNEEARTVDLVWTTGHRDMRFPFFSEPFFEELAVDEGSVRLDRLNGGANLIDSHNSGSVQGVLGVVERAWIENGKGYARVRFSDRPDAQGVWNDIQKGIIRHVSVGYKVHKFEEEKREGEKHKTLRAVDWEPFELSLVSVPFDPGASLRSDSQAVNECEFIFNESTDFIRSARMPQPQPTTEPQPQPVDLDKVKTESRTAGIEAERKRISEIRQSVRKAKLSDDFAEELISNGTSVDECRKLIIDKWSEGDRAQTHNRVQVLKDAGDKRIASVENALMNRFDSSKYELKEGKEYRGMSLLRLAEDFLGGDIKGLYPSEIALRAMHSTSDFPILLSNIVGKTLRDAYMFQPRRFVPLVRPATLNDYKPVTRVQFGAAPSLEIVREGGEYSFGTISEHSESYKLAKYGKMISITEETIINDDLDAMTRVPMMFGSSSARLESRLVWSIFLNNPRMADRKKLFHEDHKNLGKAAPINDDSLTEAREFFRSQKDKDGLDYLDLEPSFLVVGPSKETEAKKFLSTQINPMQAGDVNTFAGSLQLIVESRITGNQWFVAGSPSQFDTIEVGYLNGMREPQVTTHTDMKRDGVMVKAKHVVAAKAIDWHNLFSNPG